MRAGHLRGRGGQPQRVAVAAHRHRDVIVADTRSRLATAAATKRPFAERLQLFWSKSIGGANYSLFSNAEFDALCAEASDCTGRLFYHLLASSDRYLWDTRRVGNGAYVLRIRAYDISGNEGQRTVAFSVRN